MESKSFLQGFDVAQASKDISLYLKDFGSEVQSTQDLLDSGAIPRLKGYMVKSGKVSDSIFGGRGSTKNPDGSILEFENPPLFDSRLNPVRMLVRSAAISTHDVVRGYIPFKDQILALNHNFMRRLVERIMPHAQIDVSLPDTAVVSFALNCNRFPVENVIRSWCMKTTTTTSLYYNYFVKGEQASFCGIDLIPYAGMIKANEKLPILMVTPSTKDELRDKSVSIEDLFVPGFFGPSEWEFVLKESTAAYRAVESYLSKRGVELADTKTEHGSYDGNIYAIDELYTLDSSRFLKKNPDGTVLREDDEPVSFSKEFARGIAKGDEPFTEEERFAIAMRYMESIQMITGKPFEPLIESWESRVVTEIKAGFRSL